MNWALVFALTAAVWVIEYPFDHGSDCMPWAVANLAVSACILSWKRRA